MHPLLTRSLEYFAVIYSHRSLGQASAVLGVSQPALSKSLRQLEDDMGAALFVRRSWGLEPTKYAHTLMRHFELLSRQVTALGRDIHALQQSQLGTVQIGMNPGSAAGILPAAVLSLARKRPGIRVGLVEGDHDGLIGKVMGGELDLALTTKPSKELPASLSEQDLFDDPFMIALAADHPLRQLAPNDDLAQLLAYPWVLPPDEGLLRPRVIEMFRRLGLRAPTPNVESVSLLATIGLVSEGQFLTLQPMSVLRNRMVAKQVRFIAHPELMLSRKVVYIRRSSTELSPMAGEFLDALTELTSASG